MRSLRIGSRKALALTLLALLIVLSGCSLPFLPRPAGGTPAATSAGTEGPAATPAGTADGSIPAEVLTQVAATLYAPLQATLTAQSEAGVQAAPTFVNTQAPATAGASAPTTVPTQAGVDVQPTATQPPAPAQKTAFPTPVLPATLAAQPTTAATPANPAQPQVLPTFLPQPTVYVPLNPPSGYTAQSGTGVRIAGVNLPACGGGLTANFLVLNNSGYTFESLSLQITDLSADTNVYGPWISDAPFMFDDRVCAPGGYSHLPSGYAAFVGAATQMSFPSGHTLQGNFLFCTGMGLGGRCYPRSVEFVVP